MGERLHWGRRYLMVAPDHFRVDYSINPFMDVLDQPDPRRAGRQWRALRAALTEAGADVEVLAARPDSPDMVYAMNLGLVLATPGPDGVPRPRAVLSHMRFEERRRESRSAGTWFAEHGFATSYVGRGGPDDETGPHFEAGDAFAFGDALVVGCGPRTEQGALAQLAGDLDVRVRGLRITHPAMYHLDLAFCPLDDRRAMVAPSAFDESSARALLDLVPEPLVLSEEEALTFCANSVVVGDTVLMPSCPDRVRGLLTRWGFRVVVCEVGEFHKGGGSVRCLTNPLDVTVGRDLPHRSGGEVVLPPPSREAAA